MKRNLSIVAIIIASVAFGMILTADLGWMKTSQARQAIQTNQGPVPTMTIPSFASVAEKVMPAVVSITSTEVFKESERPKEVNPFDFFFPDPHRAPTPSPDDEHQERSGGSGFIISPDGYILTNNHVIEGATKVEVQYGMDDKTATAKIIGRDPATDIALIKINVNEQLPTVKLGDSDAIRVGDWALAIGNPLQFERTLTVGVISAKNRALGISETTRSFENFIQTDAAINFGNSGGPLLNINGEVVGINTAIRAMAQNLGFATPINIAKRILPQLKEKGKVTRGYLGIRIKEVDADTQAAFNLPSTKGAFVESVEPGQAAEKAGIQHGDVVVSVDDQAVSNTRDLISYISDQPVGTSVKVIVIRNGEKKTLTAKTAERPAGDTPAASEGDAEQPTRNKIGLSMQDLTPQTRRMYGITDAASGVLISDVKEVSPAGDAGLAQGDIVTEVNGARITSVDQFRTIVDKAKNGQYLRLYVTRFAHGGQSQSFFALIKVP
jgi:periplasmic serine protease, Do/DeqQ family